MDDRPLYWMLMKLRRWEEVEMVSNKPLFLKGQSPEVGPALGIGFAVIFETQEQAIEHSEDGDTILPIRIGHKED